MGADRPAGGVLLLPPLIWLVGSRVFGPYAAGNTRDLVDHFFRGLGQGQQAFWIVALGPYLAILIVRLTVAAVRAARNPVRCPGTCPGPYFLGQYSHTAAHRQSTRALCATGRQRRSRSWA